MKLYSIYDKVAQRFNAPFIAENDDVANRSFQNGLKNQPFAEDLDLYCLGTFFAESEKEVVSGFTVPSFVAHFIGAVVSNSEDVPNG